MYNRKVITHPVASIKLRTRTKYNITTLENNIKVKITKILFMEK